MKSCVSGISSEVWSEEPEGKEGSMVNRTGLRR